MKKKASLLLLSLITLDILAKFGDNVAFNAGLPASQNAVIASQNVVNAANIVSSTVDNNLIPASGAFGNQFGSQATNTLVQELPMITAIAAGIFVTVEATRTAVNYLPKWYSGELAREKQENKTKELESHRRQIMALSTASDVQKKELIRMKEHDMYWPDFRWCNATTVHPFGHLKLYRDSCGEPLECKKEFLGLVATVNNPEPYKSSMLKKFYYDK